ncbi:MAG: SHOCT domain-containing protein [Desulfobulbaceae bacterium]|nr:SHOCT domain-containing protein [Desulfobulbaceae bacterium]
MGSGSMLVMGLFWIAIIVGIVFLLKSLTDKAANSAHPESAVEILKKRYASGEISQDEYALYPTPLLRLVCKRRVCCDWLDKVSVWWVGLTV